MATIGQALTAPEAGWQRYEDTDSIFQYSNGFIHYPYAPASGGTAKYRFTSTNSDFIKFAFTGTRLRIIHMQTVQTEYSPIVYIRIDNVEYSYSVDKLAVNQRLGFESPLLKDNLHNVEIFVKDGKGYTFDAIDIDSNGELKLYNPSLNKILISIGSDYKKFDEVTSTWQTVTSTAPTEQDFIDDGMDRSFMETIPASAWREFDGKEIKILEYTDRPSQELSIVETEVEPYSIYDEFGDTMEVLYYTDATTNTKADLEITANYSPLDELDEDFEVVTYHSNNAKIPTIDLSFLPAPQIVEMKENVPIPIKAVNNISVTTSIQGGGTVKVAVSHDDGFTYKAWNTISKTWDTVDLSTEFKSKGMLVDELAALTTENWEALFNNGTPKIRLAYYLSLSDATSTVSISDVSFSLVVPGRWKSAIQGVDYDYEYASNEMIELSIATDGSYKINYPTNSTMLGTSSGPSYDDADIKNQLTDLQINVMKAAFKAVSANNATKYKMNQMIVDDFNDTSGVDGLVTNAIYSAGSFKGASINDAHDMSGGIAVSETKYTSIHGDIVTVSAPAASATQTLEKVFDKNTSSLYAMANNGSFDLLVQFAQPMSLSKIEVQAGSNHTMKANVQISKDSTNGIDGTWTAIGEVTYNNTPKPLSINEYGISYIKLTVENISSAWTRIGELKLFGTKTSALGAILVQSVPEAFVNTPKTLVLNAIEELNTGSITYEASIDAGTTWTAVTPETQTDLSSLPVGTELVVRATLMGEAILHAWSYSWN